MVTRGNVAIYCYNALTATTWDVTSATDGKLTSSTEDTKTILAKYFSDFTNKAGEMKLVEGIEVKETGATTLDIGANQIRIDGTTAGFDTEDTLAAFLGGLKSYPKDREEKTYGSANNVVAYIPEGTADIANLVGRKVDIIFGKDNEVVYISVADDVVENAFVEEYDSTLNEIVIAGEEYKFNTNAKVYVNGVSEDSLADLLTNLGETTKEEFTKKVSANFTLDADGKIERLDLSVSGTYADYHTIEAVVSKNSNDVLTYYYQDGSDWKKGSYDYEEALEDDKLPRVTIDGTTADITDLEAGNVVTMVYGTSVDVINVIKAVTTPVEGEVTRLQSNGKKIYVDGTAYVASMDKFTVTNENIKDGTAGTWGTTVVKEDEVTLYVNVYGEYVLVATEEANSSEWNFAYVRSIKEVDENDAEQLVAELRLLLPDGTKSSAYSIVVDVDEYEAASGKTKIATFEEFVNTLEKDVIAYKVNSDNEIVLESSTASDIKKDLLVIVDQDTKNADIKEATKVGSEFEVTTISKDATADDKRDTIGGYYFENDTVIFDMKEENILTRWTSIISSDKLVAAATVIVDNDELKYMFFTDTLTTTSDELYAIYKEVDSEEVTLVNDDGSLVLEHDDKESDIAAIATNAFVEYTVNSKNEVNAMKQLIDVKEFNKADGVIDIDEGTFAKLFVDITDVVADGQKDAFVVEKVGKLSFTYAEGTKAEDGFDTLGPVNVDEDVVVYDLRNGGFEVADFAYFTEEVAEDIYVIPFFNAEAEGYDATSTPTATAANILVIVK